MALARRVILFGGPFNGRHVQVALDANELRFRCPKQDVDGEQAFALYRMNIGLDYEFKRYVYEKLDERKMSYDKF